MAKPTSARFSAGPSLVPSPVTATTSRLRLIRLSMIPLTRVYLSWGEDRARTRSFGQILSTSSCFTCDTHTDRQTDSKHRRASLTNCNVFWTPLHGLSLAPGSMIEDCHIYCVVSCTGWTSRSGSCTSTLWWSTDVSSTWRRSTCRSTARRSLKLPVSSVCDLPLVISFYWSHDVVSAHSAVGLARRSGTHWQMNCELTLMIGLNQLWRLSFLSASLYVSKRGAEALIEIGCVVMSLVGWLSRACTVAKRCILGL